MKPAVTAFPGRPSTAVVEKPAAAPDVKITIDSTIAALPSPSATPSQAIPGDYPAEYYIRDISGHKQYFPLGCETSAAVDWALYYGLDINEYEFQTRLPQSDNPDFGFVGGVEGPWGQVPPYSYGVYAGPIASLLREYGLPAVGLRNVSLEIVKQEISKRNPVIAWVIGNMVGGIPSEYIDREGNRVLVAAYEHVVILTGYDDDSIRYMNNGNFFEVPQQVFLNSWNVLGNMAVIKGLSTSQ